ncbi:MAG: hypothetical protein HN380_23310, partial [Victivallales bacterium]|nr:hypothetical protein [Victivallales bacterium]
MNRLPASLAALLVAAAVLAAPVEVGFVEDFALAPDRTVPLKELIPGTQEYYYYHCLHYQNTGALDLAEEMLGRWLRKDGKGGQLEEMLNRQALLRYPDDPKQALSRIRQELQLTFDHARRERERETSYPTRLDPRLISREVLDKDAFAADKLLSGFTRTAARRLAGMALSPERRRTVLGYLTVPDVPNLVDLVVADLQEEGSLGFGSLIIHEALTLVQLDSCAARIPALLGNRRFVATYLVRLVPGAGEDVDAPAVRLAYLERLQAFADRLSPVWNTLKANVLYRRLAFDRTQNVHDRQRFLAYLQLPRHAAYVRQEYLRRPELRDVTVDLTTEVVGLSADLGTCIGGDELLVRAYLRHFLAGAEGYADFAPFLDESYMKEVFAEANILAGTGDQERWHAMIAPQQLRELKERVDIELLPTCRKRFGVTEPVTLDVGIKNVASLLVRVYEINALNYYRANHGEVGSSVDLDGLVANREQTFTYEYPGLRRHTETFAFLKLNRPGVWVIELIGNGRSSRAVIRKGQLRFTERTGSAGHVFRIYDQDSAFVNDATLWLGNQEYRPDEAGEIVVPYRAGAPGVGDIVLQRGECATIGHFMHCAESYNLRWQYWLPSEGLVQGEMARLLFQPKLT